MKFTKKLSAHLTPEWRKQYINYEELKSMLVKVIDNAPHANAEGLRSMRSYYANFDEEFFYKCEQELKKINNFFAEKLAEATRKYYALIGELQNSLAMKHRPRGTLSDLRQVLNKRTAQYMKFAFSEFYLSLVLLQNYQSLNHTGFRKILKKHDKLLKTDSGHQWFINNVDRAPFHTRRELMNLIRETENIFTIHLEAGDRSRAMKRLRVPPLSEDQHPWTTFRVGLFMGAFLVMLVVARLKFMVHDLSVNNYIACLQLYRGPFLLITFLFLCSINVYGWRKAGVNHILIFEINPRDHLTASHVTELASTFAFIAMLSLLGFLYYRDTGIPPLVNPLMLLLFMLGYLLNPLHICHYSARIWVVRLVGRVMAAPFYPVGFADFWLGDQLTSLFVCLVDCKYIVCFYLTNWSWTYAYDPDQCMEEDYLMTTIVRCLPAWFRFAQCWRRFYDTRLAFPHIVNAGKYASMFPVAVFSTLMAIYHDSYEYTFENPFVWGYLISYTISSSYCYAWDVLRDFGLFVKLTGENIFLRDQIVYSPIFYYFAIIEDFLLRFFWVISFYLTEQNCITRYHMNTIAAFLEVFRRYLWNYIRLENEHLYNAGNFRAVRDIAITTIDPGDQVTLQRMMDEIDGVEHRKITERADGEDDTQELST